VCWATSGSTTRAWRHCCNARWIIGAVEPMCGAPRAGKMHHMAATKFAMDVEPTQANLSSAEEAGAAQHTAAGEGLQPGGYMTALMAAIDGADAAHQAAATTRSTTNMATRQYSIARVQTAEQSNAAVLTT
jgi:hypothetical protein